MQRNAGGSYLVEVADLTSTCMAIGIKKPSQEFLTKLGRKLTAYRSVLEKCSPKRCRLVQYVGSGKPNGFDTTNLAAGHWL